jgi:hypothetical protein
VAGDIFASIPPGGGVEWSFSLGQDDIGSRLSQTTGETLSNKIVIRQFAPAIIGMLASTIAELDTTNTEND